MLLIFRFKTVQSFNSDKLVFFLRREIINLFLIFKMMHYKSEKDFKIKLSNT